mmetsp:Transcript_24202/g.76110  ORF Transcript_24202/g.76110 Transcript_24202/m.76110 type:complete len:330 (+) Transcript_24202:130-1119(+)
MQCGGAVHDTAASSAARTRTTPDCGRAPGLPHMVLWLEGFLRVRARTAERSLPLVALRRVLLRAPEPLRRHNGPLERQVNACERDGEHDPRSHPDPVQAHEPLAHGHEIESRGDPRGYPARRRQAGRELEGAHLDLRAQELAEGDYAERDHEGHNHLGLLDRVGRRLRPVPVHRQEGGHDSHSPGAEADDPSRHGELEKSLHDVLGREDARERGRLPGAQHRHGEGIPCQPPQGVVEQVRPLREALDPLGEHLPGRQQQHRHVDGGGEAEADPRLVQVVLERLAHARGGALDLASAHKRALKEEVRWAHRRAEVGAEQLEPHAHPEPLV